LDGLNESEAKLFKDTSLENIFYNASNVEQVDSKRSKSRTAVQTLQPLISAVEDYGKALDAYANIAPLSLVPIWRISAWHWL